MCRGGFGVAPIESRERCQLPLELVSGNAVDIFSGSAACLIANPKANARLAKAD